MGILEINDMIFFARHGCFEQERVIGNRFVVNFRGKCDVSEAASSDNLEDAVNYQLIYNVIKEEMEIPSNLLEHVGGRILSRIRKEFPSLAYAEISIAKMNPPIGGQVGAFKCTMSYGE